MTRKEVIRIGLLMGLKYDEKTNFLKDLNDGIVVFDGINGQRFRLESGSMPDDQIFHELGKARFLMGKRAKAMEVNNVLSITNDYDD